MKADSPRESTLDLFEKLYGMRARQIAERLLNLGGSWYEVQTALVPDAWEGGPEDLESLALRAAERLDLFVPQGIKSDDDNDVARWLRLWTKMPEEMWEIVFDYFTQLSDEKCKNHTWILFGIGDAYEDGRLGNTDQLLDHLTR